VNNFSMSPQTIEPQHF